MRVLFIGGTGNISTACTTEALRQGIEVVHFNRGTAVAETPAGVEAIRGDIRDLSGAKKLFEGRKFDCVVDWIAFTPEHVEADIELFADCTEQFIFISSASVYHKPPAHYIITESTPAYNPYWRYSQDKIGCERILAKAYEKRGFPMTIVRPSHTYSDGWFPTSFGSRDFTVPQRMIDGKRIVVHGDGQSLWTLTHADDFAVGFTGLLGNPWAIGETFHITSDEQLTWDQIHNTIAHVFGVMAKIVHIPSEVIAKVDPNIGPGLLGDKMYSVVFDNTKIKRTVPGFVCRIPFFRGMERSAAWVEAEPDRKTVDKSLDELLERLVAG